MSDASGKIDYKTIGASGLGGAALITLLMNFQQQGIELISKNNETQNRLAIEKTVANSDRIDRIEKTLENVATKLEQTESSLNHKMDTGFTSIREQIREDTGKLSDIVRIASGDRFTKTEHISYRDSVDIKIDRLQQQINRLADRKIRK